MLRRLIKYSCIFAVRMSPILNGSFVLRHFECSNAVEICNGIMFDFYPGLPHTCMMLLVSDLLRRLLPVCFKKKIIAVNYRS